MAVKQDIEFACKTCGSTDIRKDAWAEWNREQQRWVLGEVYDAAHCNACEGETKLEEKPLGDSAYTVADWQCEVAFDDTRLGYAEWLEHKIEEDRHE